MMRRSAAIAALVAGAVTLPAASAATGPVSSDTIAYIAKTTGRREDGKLVRTEAIVLRLASGRTRVVRRCVKSEGGHLAGRCRPAAFNDLSWSPDGERLVLRDHRGRLWTVEPRHGQMSLLSPETKRSESVFSPDGRRLAFNQWNERNASKLWVSAADGRGAHPVTAIGYGESPTWNAGRIVVAKRARLWSYRPDGSDARQLTHWYASSPALAPNGQVAFLRDRTVHLIRRLGGPVRVLRALNDATTVRWSPDGRRLIVTSALRSVVVADADGSDRQVVVRNPRRPGVDWSVQSAAIRPRG